MISLPFTIFLFTFFTWAGIQAFEWPESVNEFPIIATVPGAIMVFVLLLFEAREARHEIKLQGGVSNAYKVALEKAVAYRAMLFFGYLLAMVIVMLVIGQKFAIPLFIFMYLIRWGNYNWRIALAYAAGGWLMMVGFYDRILDLLWYPSWLSTWLPELLPTWMPPWLFV
jgi:putative tricarboxylic transport membrane protein